MWQLLWHPVTKESFVNGNLKPVDYRMNFNDSITAYLAMDPANREYVDYQHYHRYDPDNRIYTQGSDHFVYNKAATWFNKAGLYFDDYMEYARTLKGKEIGTTEVKRCIRLLEDPKKHLEAGLKFSAGKKFFHEDVRTRFTQMEQTAGKRLVEINGFLDTYRKMLAALTIFFTLQWSMLIWYRLGMRKISVALAILAVVIAGGTLAYEPSANAANYLQRSKTVYASMDDRAQLTASLMRSSINRSEGTGLGAGLPQVGAAPSIPAIHTDFVFAALAEELGMLGGLAVFALYGVIAQRGLRIAATAADDFRALLATGLTLVVVVQAAIIIGGNLRVIPLTGVTLPLVSYGGSSLLVNGAIVGLLLALSDGAVEPPPLPRRRRSLLGRLRRRARRFGGQIEEVVS